LNNIPKIENITIIVRSANERTRDLCVKLIREQTCNASVHLVTLVPFKRALEHCYRIAVSDKNKWLITVDADMLLLPDAIETLAKHAEEMPKNYFQLQGRIADKITGKIRKAGPRIYRVKFLDKALELSERAQNRIRPEASIVMKMGELGYTSRYIPNVTCFHDFEQYYKDLYRKSLVHAQKHPEYLISIIKRAVEHQQSDPDFRVILKAIWDGLTLGYSSTFDSNKYSDQAEKALSDLGLDEKDDEIDLNLLQKSKQEWLSKLHKSENDKGISDAPKPEYSLHKRFSNILKKKGVVNGFRYLVGKIFIDFGKNIKPD